MIKPITPDEVVEKQVEFFPEKVIAAVNKVIAKNYRKGWFSIKQDIFIAAIMEEMKVENRNYIFEMKWLDFEEIYRKAGWEIEYCKPAYNEPGDAFFKFKGK